MPSSKDLPDPGVEPESLMSPALAGTFLNTSAAWEALASCYSPFFGGIYYRYFIFVNNSVC